jgi:hypothetical protein
LGQEKNVGSPFLKYQNGENALVTFQRLDLGEKVDASRVHLELESLLPLESMLAAKTVSPSHHVETLNMARHVFAETWDHEFPRIMIHANVAFVFSMVGDGKRDKFMR